MAEGPVLLPPGSTPLEVALARIDGRILDLPSNIIRLVKRPDVAPAQLLPHLAWERSVDVWDPAWPDDVKRRVILASYIVHRYKGTRYAVEKALEALGFRASIKEWWQLTPQGEPYTFHVRGLAVERILEGRPLINEQIQRAAYAAVLAAKPVSRAFSFDIGAGFGARVGASAVGRASTITQHELVAHPPRETVSRIGAAAVGRAISYVHAGAVTAPPLRPGARFMVGARGRALQIVQARMETIAA